MSRAGNKLKLVIGSRGSKLALWQAGFTSDLILESCGDQVGKIDIKIIKTSGDLIKGALWDKGGKGLFVKELEEELLAGKIDLAVHSIKDMPMRLPAGLELVSVLERADPRDVLITRDGKGLDDLESGSTVGTGSLRRQSQLKRHRPDFVFTPLRGNVDTRLRKLREGQCEAIVLAYAGLKRMGLEKEVTEIIPTSICLPAIGQGAIGIEARADERALNEVFARIDHCPSHIQIAAERSFLCELAADCHVPIAGHGEIKGNKIYFIGLVADPDGEKIIKEEGSCKLPGQYTNDLVVAAELGKQVADQVIKKGGKELLGIKP